MLSIKIFPTYLQQKYKIMNQDKRQVVMIEFQALFFFNFMMNDNQQYIFRMGQCSLTDKQGGCGDIFSTSKGSDDSSFFDKESPTQRDRQLWDNELNISVVSDKKIPEEYFWKAFVPKQHPCFSQITKDVTRTFPSQPFFGNKQNIERFQKVLKKIALYFPHMGYTQGLNFIAGFLLVSGCQAEECFSLMTKFLVHDKILAIGLYEDNFPLVTFYCQVFWNLLEKKMPVVYGVLKKSYITDDLWLFQWFISLFLYSFPIQFVKKVWDFILCKKEMAVVLIALGIIKSIKKELIEIQFQDQIEFLDFVNQFQNIQFVKKYLDLKKIFQYANSITKSDIDRAISQTKCFSNPYRKYFSSSSSAQKEQWLALMTKFQNERASFVKTPQVVNYERADVFQNFQKMIITKYKLYQSDVKKSNSNYRRSNISSPFSINSVRSNFFSASENRFIKDRMF